MFCALREDQTHFEEQIDTTGEKDGVVNSLLNRLQSWPKEEFRNTHVKSSQLVNKKCSQQACSKLVNNLYIVTMLLFYQVATRLSFTTC
jgi:hypothetical protein